MNHGWIDLRDQPDRVANVPEAARSIGLFKLLQVIADPVSKVMSIGCECVAAEGSEEGIPRWRVGGYIAVAFKDGDLSNDPQKLVDVAQFILHGVEPSSEHYMAFEMIVEPLKFFFERTGCYALIIKPSGHGDDELTAWAAFDFATSAIADAILKGRKGG